MSRHFCPDCNRIRVTADGKLKVCLHSDVEIELKGVAPENLENIIKNAINNKPENSSISKGEKSSSSRYMSQIGG